MACSGEESTREEENLAGIDIISRIGSECEGRKNGSSWHQLQDRLLTCSKACIYLDQSIPICTILRNPKSSRFSNGVGCAHMTVV
jgi:hypothetical protein